MLDGVSEHGASDAVGAPSAEQLLHPRRTLRRRIREAVARMGIHIFLTPPRGIDVGIDLRRALPLHQFRLIFDVGANVGQSVQGFLRSFPDGCVVSFEPSSRHSAVLNKAFGGVERVRCERIALGSAEGDGVLVETADPTMFHLAKPAAQEPQGVASLGEEQVQVTTLDAYCEANGISFIDFLKVDTEGHDYEVIVGADDMLSAERIGAIQCECSVSPENTFHVSFDTVRAHLEVKGYRLFGVYEQVHEWIANRPNLRRVNAVFVSRRLMERYA